jgi:LEA14-like dessication related protein
MKKLKYLAFLFLLPLTACQSFNSLVKEPVVSLNSVEITGISFRGIDFIARVDVENPNSISIPLPKIDWELFVNSSSFINGSLKKNETIKSGKKVTIDLPFGVTYEGLYKSVSSVIKTKEAAYDIALGVSFPIPIIESKVFKLSFSGVLPLPELPKIKAGSVSISKVDFTGAELSCALNVENPNRFPIPFPKLEYNYEVNGVPLLKSSFTGTGEIAAGAAAAAAINLSVSYADLFKAVSSLKSKGEAETKLSVGLNSGETGFSASILGDIAGNVLDVLDISGVLPILQKPEVSFQGLAKKSLGAVMEFIVSWEINNTNNFGFDIGEFVYDLKVNNNAWAQGRINNPPKVKAGGKTVIPLTVSVSALSIVKELADVINRGSELTYNCTGNMVLLSDFPGLPKLELPLNLAGNSRIQ